MLKVFQEEKAMINTPGCAVSFCHDEMHLASIKQLLVNITHSTFQQCHARFYTFELGTCTCIRLQIYAITTNTQPNKKSDYNIKKLNHHYQELTLVVIILYLVAQQCRKEIRALSYIIIW